MVKTSKRTIRAALFFYGIVLPLLCSCIGVRAEITLKDKDSGVLLLEYRFSKQLEALGRLDGNERWQTVPSGKADLERSLSRIPGMKLKSFFSKEEGRDIINRAELEFESIQALLSFFDAYGERARLTEAGGKNRLSMVLNSGSRKSDPELLKLLQQVTEGYEVFISVTAPSPAELALSGAGGLPAALPNGAALVSPGKTVSFRAPVFQVLSAEQGMTLHAEW